MKNKKSYSYRYLVNSYEFLKDTLSLKHSSEGAPHPYLINHKEKCQGQDVLLLLFIKTPPENYE
jgi:beta-1,3-N-acetylglucosaminyltransferase 5